MWGCDAATGFQHLRLSLSDNHNDSETLTDYVTV